MHQPLSGLRQRMIVAAEELFLEIVRRSPGEHGRNVEAFSGNLRPHVFRTNAFGGVLIMRTSRRMDMVIPGVPPVARRIDPARQPEQPLIGTSQRDATRLGFVLRTARHGQHERA